jgi:D-alanyl-D-alanine carboxypeptidase
MKRLTGMSLPTSLGRWLMFAALLSASAAAPSLAYAHLALIRQGPESAGNLNADERTGSALATGDFNADGYDDLVIGSPGDRLGPFTDAGSAVVVFGSRFGLTHVGAVLLSASLAGGDNSADAAFGSAIATGRFNDDLYDDVAIGAPMETVGGTTNAGRIYVFHGGPSGVQVLADTFFTQGAADEPIESGDEFGAALVAGDFNGDGRDDLAVGSPGEDFDAGAIFQFPGSADGITRIGAGIFKQADLGGANTTGDRFGHALAAGDLFDDAREDLAASAPYRARLPLTVVGVVYLLPGSASGLTASGALSYSADDADGAQSSGRFGFALAVGQFGAGAYRSIAIGEPGRDISGRDAAGRILAVHGFIDGLDWTDYRIVSQVSAGGTVEDLDRFGSSLAAGDRWSVAAGTWGADGYDELAVGTPYENGPGGEPAAGLVQILRGTSTTVTGAGAESYAQPDLGDDAESFDQLGGAVAFGNFDDSGFANLAVGAAGESTSDDLKYDESGNDIEEFSNAGCVFISAPWRQVLGLKSRGTVVYNCQFELVYSQRPFDRVRPASTTKTMTVLLACEHMDSGHPDHVDSTTVYEVPYWVDQIQGSSASLEYCERMRFMDIARACMAVSGNDAAYAIANLLEPEVDDKDVSLFVGKMNQRADEIGMTGTRFSNPAGRDKPEDETLNPVFWDNYTTPVDMALLSREAMFNPIFRGIAGVEEWDIGRNFPLDIALDCESAVRQFPLWSYDNDFLEELRDRVPTATGIKPGNTTAAQRTRLLSADKDAGRVIVARFGIPGGVSKAVEDSSLLALGAALCDDPFVFERAPEPMPGPYVRKDQVPTVTAHREGGAAAYEREDSESTGVAVHLQSGTGPAALRFTVARSSEALLAPQQVASYHVEPFQQHEGMRLVNYDIAPVTLRVTTTHPPMDVPITIPANGDATLPPYTGASASLFTMTLSTLGTAPIEVGVEENGYAYEITVGSGPPNPGSFGALLGVSGPVERRNIALSSLGRDANPGRTVLYEAFPPGASVVGVEPPVEVDAARPLSLASPPWPNPFRGRVHFLFDVRRSGSVRLAIYDLRGRQVWSRQHSALRTGRWSSRWEGTDGARAAAPGIYFYRIWFDGRAVEEGKISFLGR